MDSSSNAQPFAWLPRALNLAQLVCGLLTLALLALVLGFPLGAHDRDSIHVLTRLILGLFAAQEVARFVIAPRRLAHLRSRKLEASLALVVALELVFRTHIVAWIDRLGTGLSPAVVTLLYLGGAQATLLGALALRALRDNRLLHNRALSPGMVFIGSFGLLIAVGTLLLKTPHATHAGIGWIDALFVATSAVCVTGLSTVDVAATFTLHGQWVLLGLIQLGGLGVMTITYFFAYFLAGGVSLRNRIGLQDLLSEENLGQIGGVLATIIAYTLGVELVGAMFIHASLNGAPNAPENLAFFSLFHAVSAFCNAGFSTLPANLADPAVAGHAGFLSLIMGLIVLGGIGFPVAKNFRDYAGAVVRRRLGLRLATPPRLTAHSRLVLITTALLIAGGAALIWLTEFAFGRGQGQMAAGSPWLTAFFHSITARTAGFNVTPVSGLLPASAAVIMLLMFVGGGPASTAGGIKTSTLAVAFLSLRRVLFGRRDIEAFGRRLPDELANRALSIILVAIGFTTAVSVALCTLHPELPAENLVFEAVSAIGTVGLSRDITPALGDPAKLLVAFSMLVGRVGVLAFLAAFVRRRETTGLRLPETNIVLS